MDFTKQIDKAIRVASVAHADQVRKSTDIPYIMHPFSVMTIAAAETSDEATLIACLLHDVLEDAPEKYSRDDMARDFGSKVVEIVMGVTKSDSLTDWQQRSEAYLAHLRTAPIESVIVSVADKTHNLMSILIDYEVQGDAIWDRFNSSRSSQLWWYESILVIADERLPDSRLVERYRVLVDCLRVIVQ